MDSPNLPANKKIVDAAKKLWQYMKLNHPLKPVGVILVFCSNDDRIANYAAKLYSRELSKLVLVSGGIAHQNDLLKTKWGSETEAQHFANILINSGVPSSSIILEQKATNSGENIKFSYELLKNEKIPFHSILLIQKPYMERRTYATFMKQWPGSTKNVTVTSPPCSLKSYLSDDQPFELVVNIMVGDLQRIIKYPALGYQIYQKVPRHVLTAYQYLIKNNYNKHLIQH